MSGIRDILGSQGLHEIWYNQGGTNPSVIANVVKKYLKVDFLKYWNSQIFNNEHSRYHFYSKLKSQFQIENYLKLIDKLNPILRNHLVKLRTSCHSLLVEKGRHLGLPREQRLCQVCSKIEDEEHFLFHCSKYQIILLD